MPAIAPNRFQLNETDASVVRTIAKDSKSVWIVVLIPLAVGLIFWRLIQWHWMARRRPELLDARLSFEFASSPDGDPGAFSLANSLALSFRQARYWLWAGFLFWPIVWGGVYLYSCTVDFDVAQKSRSQQAPITSFQRDDLIDIERR